MCHSAGTCLLAVAVVRNTSSIDIRSLKGAKSCHSGARWTSGWNLPLGQLLSHNLLPWAEGQPLSQGIFYYVIRTLDNFKETIYILLCIFLFHTSLSTTSSECAITMDKSLRCLAENCTEKRTEPVIVLQFKINALMLFSSFH